MKTRAEYIQLLSKHTDELRSRFGVSSLRLLGSVSRDEQHENSEVDVCVEMESKAYLLVRLNCWDVP